MEFWLIALVGYIGLVVLCQALKYCWVHWYSGHLNRKPFEEWHRSSRR